MDPGKRRACSSELLLGVQVVVRHDVELFDKWCQLDEVSGGEEVLSNGWLVRGNSKDEDLFVGSKDGREALDESTEPGERKVDRSHVKNDTIVSSLRDLRGDAVDGEGLGVGVREKVDKVLLGELEQHTRNNLGDARSLGGLDADVFGPGLEVVSEIGAFELEVELEVVPDRREVGELGAEGHCPLITNVVPAGDVSEGVEGKVLDVDFLRVVLVVGGEKVLVGELDGRGHQVLIDFLWG
mmetsp:Transcript_5297/g.8736  ORF Transcript_5297/g.8736 Transcript_5297/m.8736 type:complete len:240 (+) Transcript_5297:405-1124(+)